MNSWFRKILISLRFSLGGAFISITLLTSLLLGVTTYVSVRSFIREGIEERLRDAVAIAALQIDVEKHRKLLQREDEGTADYGDLKKSLQNIRNQTKNIRFIYTLRKNSEGKIVFVVDAEENQENLSHIGDAVDDLTPSMLAAFTRPYQVHVEKEFNKDKWGTWLSSFAPFLNPDGNVEGVLGIDMSAKQIVDYERHYLVIILLISLAISMVVVGLSILFSRRISRPLLILASEMSLIQNFELDNQVMIRSRVKEVIDMKTAVENMKNGLRSFKKYVPSALVAELIKLQKEAVLGAEKRELSVFFSDIADFTSISEKLPPESLADHLAVYFEGMTKIMMQNGGTIDKYIGDAIMAFWGAPSPNPDHGVLACRSALQCRRFLNSLSAESQRSGAPVFKTRMGINSGELIVGNMGYKERLNYTVMGDNVNLASRLEGLNKYYGTQIIISGSTYELVRNDFEARMIDVVAVKGKKRGVAIYELVSEKGDLEGGVKSLLDLFNEGMSLYLGRRWGDAAEIFREACRRDSTDKPSHILLERCQAYAIHPPPEGWDGVTERSEK